MLSNTNFIFINFSNEWIAIDPNVTQISRYTTKLFCHMFN